MTQMLLLRPKKAFLSSLTKVLFSLVQFDCQTRPLCHPNSTSCSTSLKRMLDMTRNSLSVPFYSFSPVDHFLVILSHTPSCLQRSCNLRLFRPGPSPQLSSSACIYINSTKLVDKDVMFPSTRQEPCEDTNVGYLAGCLDPAALLLLALVKTGRQSQDLPPLYYLFASVTAFAGVVFLANLLVSYY